jgi:hypothetical protein
VLALLPKWTAVSGTGKMARRGQHCNCRWLLCFPMRMGIRFRIPR